MAFDKEHSTLQRSHAKVAILLQTFSFLIACVQDRPSKASGLLEAKSERLGNFSQL